MTPDGRLGRRTWPDVGRPIVVVPVGSCEQHGPHLPLDTDTVIATALADGLAERRTDCLVAPALSITASGEHAGFPGTLSIGSEITAGAVIELARSADWAAGVVFVNGHGGNTTPMHRAADVFEHERRHVLIWWPPRDRTAPPTDLHAGHVETSLMLAIAPETVRLERAVAGTTPPLVDLVNDGVRAHSSSGVLGDPGHASAAAGARILERLIDRLVADVARWSAGVDVGA
ncbi:MAG: mycofactocin biosynthesis peptidyl-dipeptidase MftE [Ilumatobacteraceae bacterium]